MSFLAALSPYGLDFADPGVAAMARGAIITNRVGLGWSNNAIQRELSANGLGIGVGQLDPMVRAERARQAPGPAANQLGVDIQSGALLPGVAPAGWTGQYVHQVTVTYRTKDQAGNFALHTEARWVKAGNALSPAQAAQSALDTYTEGPSDDEEPTGPEMSQVLSASLSGVWYEVPRSRNAA